MKNEGDNYGIIGTKGARISGNWLWLKNVRNKITKEDGGPDWKGILGLAVPLVIILALVWLLATGKLNQKTFADILKAVIPKPGS